MATESGTPKQDLIERARERSEGSSGVTPEEWGELLELDEDGGSFFGRYRGKALDERWEPVREVFLFLDEEGGPAYMPTRYRLAQELEPVALGDNVAIFRGPNYETKAGNEGHSYGVASEPNDEPLPESAAAGEFPF